jgi:esterase/lipase superfamily enzyme
MLRDLAAVEPLLAQLGIPAWVDRWGYDVSHDWPWWKKQLPYFLNVLCQVW